MEYDKRITNPDMILSCFDVKFVMANYRNKNGYFTDCIDYYADLSKCHYGKLTDIRDDDHAYYLDSAKWYNFFLPESSIKPKKKEKKYRPYTMEDFEISEFVVFREKSNPSMEYHVRYNGYRKYDNFYKVILGNISYTFSDLFEDFERFYNGRWFPFGVEE